MASSKWMSVCGLIGTVAIGSIAACSNGKPANPMAIAGQGGTPTIEAVDNPGSGGSLAAGSGGAGTSGAAGSIAAGAGAGAGVAGSAGSAAGAGGAIAGAGGAIAGAGGATAAAGSGGMAGGSAAGAGGESADAGPAEDDPFGGLFDPPPTSCEGLLCLEDADCTNFYPDEAATCKLTRCVDLVCE
jgi:hypothetical protein